MQMKAACRQKKSLQTSKSEVGGIAKHGIAAHRTSFFLFGEQTLYFIVP